MTATTDLLDGRDGRIAVHRWSPPVPRGLLLLAHGYGEHAGRYAGLGEHLAARGWRVVAPDHAGHGCSDGERALLPDLERLADDLALVGERALADAPELPLALLGHSLGGIVATRLAQRRLLPLAGLALSGPVIGGNPEILALLDLDPIPEVPIDPAILSRDPAVGAAYAADPLVHHGPFRRETLEGVAAAVAAIAAAPPLGDLPLLWLHGEEDALAPLAVTRTAIGGLGATAVEQHVYPGARHEVLNETNRDEIRADLDRFLDRLLVG
ncbi:alpha/beta hydrolase [Patulibacter defluvii]|uniref:alpha/beta hydrolase n=1 Tax=Patulibacter defluvii TaxID=3095358 RepID=UPI002A7621BF|nr:alpha/beta hydrolase [Patulibacter sp. DM4]